MADENGKPAERTTKIEFALAVLMALAAVGTAWAGFQSTEWSGVQANSYAQASKHRIESNRFSGEADQDRIIDIVAFGSWLSALDDEILADPSRDPSEVYEPGTESTAGFLFIRFRDEFEPAMEAWLATEPFDDPDAPSTPFEMPEYQLSAQAEAGSLWQQANDLSAEARRANTNSTNYILNAVLFALVLFFAGIASRAHGPRAQQLLFWCGIASLVLAVGVLLTMPVTI